MANWQELRGRLEQLPLITDGAYRGQPLPAWLRPALTTPAPVYVVSVRGVPCDDTLCILRLKTLEDILEDVNVLTPDRLPWEAVTIGDFDNDQHDR